MNKLVGRAAWALALATSLTLLAPVSAGAKLPPITTVQQYRLALHVYQKAKNVIDATLHRAIVVATATEVAAMVAATSPVQIYLARVDFNVVRAAALATWQAALAKLGPPPHNPLNPTTTTTLAALPLLREQIVDH